MQAGMQLGLLEPNQPLQCALTLHSQAAPSMPGSVRRWLLEDTLTFLSILQAHQIV